MANLSRAKVGIVTAVSAGSAVFVYYLKKHFIDDETAVRRTLRANKSSVKNNSVSSDSNDDNSMTLKYVQVFFRHGARTPLSHIPGIEEVVYDRKLIISPLPHMEIPYSVEHLHGGPQPESGLQTHYAKTQFKGGCIAGELTNIGKNQAYLLGSRLARRYGDFYGNSFHPRDYVLRSTNIERCIQSLQCVLAGMFGYTSALDNVVIKVEDLKEEILFPNSRLCENFQKLSRKSQEHLERQSEYVNLVKKIQKHTGQKFDITKLDIMQVRDNIIARQTHGLPVPSFLIDMFPDIDSAAVKVLTTVISGNVTENPTQGLKFSIGRLFYMVQENIRSITEADSHRKNKNRSKMALYSCHDSTLAPMLSAMGCYDNKWPQYSADIAIELYEDGEGQHWVKVLYCDKAMTLRGCSSPLITSDNFFEVIEPYTIETNQYKIDCSNENLVQHVGVMENVRGEKGPIKQYESPPNV